MNNTYIAGPSQATPQLNTSPRTRSGNGLQILIAAVTLGVLGNALLRPLPWGIGLTIWIGALILAAAMLARWRGVLLVGDGRWMALPAAGLAAAIAWRASPALILLNTLGILTVLALGAFRARSGSLRAAGVAEYVWGWLVTGVNAAVGVLFLVFGDVKWKEFPLRGRGRNTAAMLRGVLLAAPLLVLFGALFAAADPVFERLVGRLFHWQPEGLGPSLFWTVFWTWITAGFLRQILLGSQSLPVDERTVLRPSRTSALAVGGIEVLVVLALLNVLFLVFVLVQFRYLFGGAELVADSIGLSYAEYARRGFFELVAVGALVLPVLLTLGAVFREDDPQRERQMRTLMAMLVGLLLVILFSAVQRMRLYQSEYGLTELRLYTSAFMAWLAVVFLWFAATVLRGRREHFAWGAMMAALGTLGLLNILNPDALITRTNLAHAASNTRFDAGYLADLSADAAPELVAALPALPPGDRCMLAARMLERWGDTERPDWRTWNWGRTEAHRVVRENAAQLRAITCPRPAPF
jgi:hypothetical protein